MHFYRYNKKRIKSEIKIVKKIANYEFDNQTFKN